MLVTCLAPSHYLNQCWNIVDWTLGTNFSEMLIEIHTFSFKKIHSKMSSGKWQPFCRGPNVLDILLPVGYNRFILQLIHIISYLHNNENNLYNSPREIFLWHCLIEKINKFQLFHWKYFPEIHAFIIFLESWLRTIKKWKKWMDRAFLKA